MSRHRSSCGLAVALAALLALAACGEVNGPASGGADAGDSADSGAADPADEVLDIDAALAQPDGSGVTVSGYLHGEHGATDAYRLCSEQLESFPPQCGGSEIYIVDADALVAQLAHRGVEVQRDDARSWTDTAIEVDGLRQGPDGVQPIAPPATPDPDDSASPGMAGGVIEVVERDEGDDEPADLDVEAAPIDPDAIQQYPVAPHRAVLVDDTTLELHLWGGVDPCWALHSIEVSEDDEAVVVDLLAGTPADAADEVCIAEAAEWAVTVELDEPLDDRDLISRH